MKTYYNYSSKRGVVWGEICRFLNNRFIKADDRVLEIGCGYGDFISQIRAKQRAAIELNSSFKEILMKYDNIKFYFDDALKVLPKLEKDSFDVVFCSNYFEHFSLHEIERQLSDIARVLIPSGRLIILQPNFRLCSSIYFDDWTHKTIFSHISFADLLRTKGFRIIKCYDRLLPHSMNSRLPVNKYLVRLYLNSIVKPFATQFFIVAENDRNAI